MAIYFSRPENFRPKFSAAGIYLIHDGKILFLKYARKYDRAWTLPSGKINSGEEEIDGIIRETLEETGIILDKKNVKQLFTAHASYPDNDFDWFVYRYDFDEEPTVTLSDEHDDYVWVTPKEALTMKLIAHEVDCLKRIFRI